MKGIRSIQITVKLSEQEHEALLTAARQNKLQKAEQVRRYIRKGISLEAYHNDEEKILANMREALHLELEPQVDQLVKICVKNSISSTMNLLFTALFVQSLVEQHARPKMQFLVDEARKHAIRFTSLSKGSVDTFLKQTLMEMDALWERNFR